MVRQYQDKIAQLWCEEVEMFSQGYVTGLLKQGKKKPSRTALYKKLMGEKLKIIGFEFDKEISEGF